MNDHPARAFVAEAIGTFGLCFIAILAVNAGVLSGHADGTVSLTSVAFANGLVIAALVAALAALSGAHFNPAVTAGFVFTGRMPWTRGLGYVAAQVGGAVLASAVLAALFGTTAVAAATPTLSALVSPAAGTVIEVFTTFLLVLVIFGTAVDDRAPKSVFPLAIGLVIVADIMATGPLTGAAMNPARVLGPALVSGAWTDHWVYWAGPLAGGVLAARLQHNFLLHAAPSPTVAARGGPSPHEERGHA